MPQQITAIISTIAVSVILVLTIAAAIKKLIKERKNPTCHNCSGCPHANACKEKDNKQKEK